MNSPPVSVAHAEAVLGAGREAGTKRSGGELRLVLDAVDLPDPSLGRVPAYRFHLVVNAAAAGTISLRVGDNQRLVRYAGQVGFAVDPVFRGQGLAERATRLLLPLARSHGLDPLWITCNPDNAASVRTIERLGGVFVESVDLPPDYDRHAAGERRKLRYRIDLGD